MKIHKNAKVTPVQRKLICSLRYDEGCRVTDLAKQFHVSRKTIYIILNRGIYGDFTLHKSVSPSVEKNRKCDRQDYIDSVFKILHAPPSSYGFNRTTWRLVDLQTTLVKQGYPISVTGISRIIKSAGYSYRKAKKALTSNDPDYENKMNEITRVLSNLQKDEKFFSVDEFGPVSVKVHGGRALTPPGQKRTIPRLQKSKGKIILTAGLELSENQISYLYSEKKNTTEMIRFIELILEKYKDQKCIYILLGCGTMAYIEKVV